MRLNGRGLLLAGAALAQTALSSGVASAPLSPAVGGERRSLEVPGFGRVVYYADSRGTGRPLILTHSVLELYSKLRVPTVILYDQDGFVSFERLPIFVQQPGVSAGRIPGTDGLPHFEKPAEVRAALDHFWATNR